MKRTSNNRSFVLIFAFFITTFSWGQTPYPMSSGNYLENFADIANWTNNFTSGTGANRWASYPITSGGSANDGVRTTKSSATFVTSTTGGIQRGSGNFVFLSTGSGTPSEAVAVDLLLDFTGRNAGTLSFDWAAIDNGGGTRPTSLRVFWSTDNSTFTEITAAQVIDIQSVSSGSITTVALPTNFNNSATARLRFYNHAGTVTGSGNRDKISIDNISVTSTPSVSTPPTLTADITDNNVDNDITITFADDPTWRSAVTEVKIGATTLSDISDYLFDTGVLYLIPDGGNSALTTSGSKNVTVIATGYSDATVTQVINAGAPNKLAIKTEPTAPATNGGVLATQPAVYIQDQYGNNTTSTADVTAAVGAGSWTLGGTTTVAGSSGTVTYSGLTATSLAEVIGATINFTSTGLTGVTSETFNISAPAPQIEWANLQWPSGGTISLGGNYNVYAQVYKTGVTDATGQGAGIQAWIGYSETDTDPSTWTNWVPATYNTDDGNNDEYVANIGADISAAGSYYYASRFQLGSAIYVYGGFNGGFWNGTTNVSGTLTVNPAPTLDWVNLQYPSSGNILTSGSFDVYAQVYELGLTEAAGQAAGITAWIGYSTNNDNPNTWTNWIPATFNTQQNNNDEYIATISGLAAGTYYYASRFKYGLADYVYGGYSGTNGGFWDGTTNVSGILTVSTPEPTDYPTLFSAATIAPTHSSIKLTWDDASGAEKYLIKGSDVSYNDITAPVDGTPEADGGLVKNIASGTEEHTFTGLTASTTYFFKIFPYNGTGANINFKTDGIIPEATATTDATPTLLLVEDFDYAAGLLTANNWTNHSGTNDLSVTTGSISYPGYLSSGIGNETSLLSSQSGDNNRTFTAQTSGAVYVSFLVNVSATTTGGDYFLHLGQTTMGTTFRGRVFVKRDASNNLAFGIAQNTGTPVYSGLSYAMGTTYLIVLKFNIVSGASNDNSAIFVSPALNSAEPVLGWISSTDASGTDLAQVGSVAIRQGGNVSAKIDGIRVSTSWADIVGPAMTFTGTGSWTSASNWSNNTAPLKYNVVTIDGAATVSADAEVGGVSIKGTRKLTIDNGNTLNVNGDFIIMSDATSTGSFIDNGTLNISGNVIVQSYLADQTNTGWYVSSPLSNAKGDVFNGSYAVYAYDSENAQWNTVGSGDNLEPVRGYVTKFGTGTGVNDKTVEFTGAGNTLNTGTKTSSTLYRTGFGGGNYGWNLVGNPYPSAIDWDASSGVTKTNLNNATYIRKANGTVATYNGTGVNGGSRYIAPGQAFWVQVAGSIGTPTGTGTLSFTNDARVHMDINLLKSTNEDGLRLTLSRNNLTDEMIIRFKNGASDVFDPMFDAVKMFSENNDIPQIYSVLNNDEQMAINSYSELLTDKSVVVAIQTNVAGNHTITADDLSAFDSQVSVLLEDTYTNSIIDLRQQNSYTFNTAVTSDDNRFVVHFVLGTTSDNSLNNSGINATNIYSFDKAVYITNIVSDDATAVIYNLLGQEVLSQKLQASPLNKLNAGLVSGQYIVKVVDNSNVVSQKVFIK